MEEDRSRHPSASNTFVSDMEEMVRADRRVPLMLLELAFNLSHTSAFGHSAWKPRVSQFLQQMGAETTVRPTEAWQNGRLSDQPSTWGNCHDFSSHTVTGDRTGMYHYSLETKVESIVWKHIACKVKGFRKLWARIKWWQQSSDIFTEPFSLISDRVVRRWLLLPNRRRYNWRNPLYVGGLACFTRCTATAP
jgi:hypothetical protein